MDAIIIKQLYTLLDYIRWPLAENDQTHSVDNYRLGKWQAYKEAKGYVDFYCSTIIDQVLAELKAEDGLHDSLHKLFSFSDEMFRYGLFNIVDDFLGKVDAEKFSIDILIGILTATLAAKKDLKNRKKLYNNIKSRLIKENEPEIDQLLMGLE